LPDGGWHVTIRDAQFVGAVHGGGNWRVTYLCVGCSTKEKRRQGDRERGYVS
jgi:hypothetical protein